MCYSTVYPKAFHFVNEAVVLVKCEPFCLIIISSRLVWVKRERRLNTQPVCSQQAPAKPAGKSRGAHLKWQWLSDRGCLTERYSDSWHFPSCLGQTNSHTVLAFVLFTPQCYTHQGLLCTGWDYVRCLRWHPYHPLLWNFVLQSPKSMHNLFFMQFDSNKSVNYAHTLHNEYCLYTNLCFLSGHDCSLSRMMYVWLRGTHRYYRHQKQWRL